ncbi:UvrD-helicase domain-containing protein [Undibacterium sp.]|uniref:UvrD-helicase domain-containing protein n=1 Tax=Undibacterium sp. TaxID=1914977 RepID=UPI002732035B|nr:UvrD-helicase domain-containing protein [Undibacterium sp.]MDP1979160.1 AAA family ATPase [Undibacterium sp.]
MSLKPKVALSQDFLFQLAKLPSGAQSKVLKWAVKFQADPKSPGINYEKINAARDPNLKSVRLDLDWRGIIFKPDRGDVYVLLHVDHHDEAYRWAERRKIAINPVTGAMQIVFLEEVAAPPRVDPTETSAPIASAVKLTGVSSQQVLATIKPPLFATLSDRQLMSIGVPEDWIGRVQGIQTEDELDGLQASLPVEAYEGLFLVAAGDTIDQVLTSRETRIDRAIDTTDFITALTTPESQSRFVIVDDDEAMLAIMNAPLAQWRIFLHPTQHKLAGGDRSGPVRILGGAGTGKTVVAMHRAKWLAENRTPDGKKVLFTTFTKNLALDIEDNLKTLCSPNTMAKIEVRNLDAWVHGFMRSRKLEHKIVYDRSQDGALQAWQSALAVKDASIDLPTTFYEQEFEQVILAQGVTTRDEYRAARRTGRGVILSRAKRDAIWPVFEEYRGQLTSRKLKEVDDAYRDIANVLQQESESQTPALPYSAIVIDETQDFGPQALKLLRAMMPRESNDLFFVGDGHQRIYSRHRAAMSKCGIDIRGRSRKLYLNYRTTDEIRRLAVAMLEGCDVDDLDEGHDETRRYKSLSHGPVPGVVDVESIEAAITLAIDSAKSWQRQDEQGRSGSTCVIASNRSLREAFAKQFAAAGFKTSVIDANQNVGREATCIHFATMHRAKGLEFDRVIVVAPASFFGNPLDTDSQRKLIYVALTRAKCDALMLKI